jgi:hypothetical protein
MRWPALKIFESLRKLHQFAGPDRNRFFQQGFPMLGNCDLIPHITIMQILIDREE